MTNESKLCNKCGQGPIKGSDPCFMGKLPGVIDACCGHGKCEGYIYFEEGTVITGIFYKIYRKYDPIAKMDKNIDNLMRKTLENGIVIAGIFKTSHEDNFTVDLE
jgi:hypothetical protein